MTATCVFLKVLLTFTLTSSAFSFGLEYLTEDDVSKTFGKTTNRLQPPDLLRIGDAGSEMLSGEGRILLPIFLGSGGLNLTVLAALAALAAATLLPLLGLAALGLLLWAVLAQQSKDSGYGHTGYSGPHSSYSSSYRSFDLADTDWESLSLLEWLSVAEETYTKYEPTNIDCQKRVICELFQHAHSLGSPAQTFMQYFSYLNYAEVFNLPESVKDLIQELVDAAERGSLKKDCEAIFSNCMFSLKEIVEKYGHGRFLDTKENKI